LKWNISLGIWTQLFCFAQSATHTVVAAQYRAVGGSGRNAATTLKSCSNGACGAMTSADWKAIEPLCRMFAAPTS
jgi:hypothetical protein